LRYSEDITERYTVVLETLAEDEGVSTYAGRVTANYKTMNTNGKYENISIQNGDFTKFPVPYLQGDAPASEGEIALSLLNSRNYGKSIGDSIEILVEDAPVALTVCGIYQDLTNGGKSAQAFLPVQPEDVLWYAVLLDFSGSAVAVSIIESYRELFAPAKVVDIEGYMSQSLASTIQQFKSVALAVAVVSIIIAVLITALFMNMLLAKDRRQIIAMKGLGFTSAHIQTQYVSATVLSLLIGLALGTIAANTLGELLIGMLMSGMGASRISFVVDPLMSFAVCPLLLLIAVTATTLLAAHSVRKSGNYIISE
jgi:putative ABC transport system permease protein